MKKREKQKKTMLYNKKYNTEFVGKIGRTSNEQVHKKGKKNKDG